MTCPYPAYREGIAWAPRLPSHWRNAALRWLADIYAGGTPSKENLSFWSDGTIPWLNSGSVNDWSITQPSALITEEALASSSARWVPAQSVVIGLAGQGRTKGTAARLEFEATTNQSMAAIVPAAELDYRFLHYWLVANYQSIRNLAGGDKRDGLNLQHIASVDVVVPPLEEQHAIADYLDRETSRIDTLIDEQQRLIGTLRERRRSAASDLLGDRVGEGTRLKWFFDELDRRAGVEADTLPLMSVSISWGVRRRDEVTKDESRAEDLSNYKICRRGDLVINRMRAFQGALGLAPEDGLVSPDYAVIRARPEVDGEWLAAVMKSDGFVSEMRQRVKGIGSTDLGSARTPRINISDLGEIRIEVPEVEQQVLEVRQERTQTVKIDGLIMETERFIELSRERRSALIMAAVTGQMDVREML